MHLLPVTQITLKYNPCEDNNPCSQRSNRIPCPYSNDEYIYFDSRGMEIRPIITTKNCIHLSFTLSAFTYNTKLCYTISDICKPHHSAAKAANVSFSYSFNRQVADFVAKLRFIP
jgi:hypothetical protein